MAQTGQLTHAPVRLPGFSQVTLLRIAIVITVLVVWEATARSGLLYRDVVPSLLVIGRGTRSSRANAVVGASGGGGRSSTAAFGSATRRSTSPDACGATTDDRDASAATAAAARRARAIVSGSG